MQPFNRGWKVQLLYQALVTHFNILKLSEGIAEKK